MLQNSPQSAANESTNNVDKYGIATKNRLLIVGYGRVGQEVAQLAAKQQPKIRDDEDVEHENLNGYFDQIVGTVRDETTAAKAAEIASKKEVEEEKDDTIIVDAACPISCIPISDLNNPDMFQDDSYYSHVLIAMPPVDEYYQAVLDSFLLSAESKRPKWLGMVSTTGVYGNHNGDWVTEESELKCTIESGSKAPLYVQWERAFEKAVLGSTHNQVRVFRCAGIYDSTKSALHTLWKQKKREAATTEASSSAAAAATIRDNQHQDSGDGTKNKTTPEPAENKTNRIHVTDIAQSIVNSMMMTMRIMTEEEGAASNSISFEIYNLADDLPERRSKVMDYASKLLTTRFGSSDWRTTATTENVGVSKSADGSDDQRSGNDTSTKTSKTKSVRRTRREQEPKLIDNQKLKNTLLPELLYPTYKEGLNDILLDPQAPWNNLNLEEEEEKGNGP
ncbi:MAG: hypothetical protein SGBAC_008961 [Bacillariaceae sp.]